MSASKQVSASNNNSWERNSPTNVYTERFTGFQNSLPHCVGLLSFSPACTLSLPLSDTRSQYGASLRAQCLAYQFIITHFIFIFNLCGKIHSRFVVAVCVVVRVPACIYICCWWFLTDWGADSRLSRVNENTKIATLPALSKWRKHSSLWHDQSTNRRVGLRPSVGRSV